MEHFTGRFDQPRGDTQTIIDQLADDVGCWLETMATNIPYSGVRRGKKEVLRFFEAAGFTREHHTL